jgi:regulator of sirC expression with transglutaminase-like and TPR domain
MRARLLCLVLGVAYAGFAPWCARASDTLAAIQAHLALPNPKIDFAEAKLAVDALLDPSTDIAAVRRQIMEWERKARANIPANATVRDTFDALVRTLYEPGHWNDFRPFSYDLDDPLGRKPETKRLATYLASRKGNCVSMPILFVILGQRLGLPVTLALAPRHVLVKFKDETHQAWRNFEATHGAFKADSATNESCTSQPKRWRTASTCAH